MTENTLHVIELMIRMNAFDSKAIKSISKHETTMNLTRHLCCGSAGRIKRVEFFLNSPNNGRYGRNPDTL